MADDQERLWAMLVHLASFLGFIPFGHLFGPLAIWLWKRKEMPLVDKQGKESLNFQLSMTLYILSAGILVLLGLPEILVNVLGLVALVLVITAALKVRRGESFRYPLTYRFIR